MSGSKRAAAALVAVLGMILAAFSFASSATAVPAGYSHAPTVGVSTTSPGVGSTITVSGSGFASGETVNITVGNYGVGAAHANRAGEFRTQVSLPSGLSGSQTLTATGETSGHTASITLCIGGNCGTAGGPPPVNNGGVSNGGANNGGGGGILASTGVAVIGIGGLGLVLLLGGGLMLLAGRRRNAAV
jgi:hypothetical protein